VIWGKGKGDRGRVECWARSGEWKGSADSALSGEWEMERA